MYIFQENTGIICNFFEFKTGGHEGRLFFIEAANDFVGTLFWDDSGELPVTSKQDKAMHGMGLTNIRRCARKYKGEIDIQVTEENGKKRFLLTVMLYEKESD